MGWIKCTLSQGGRSVWINTSEITTITTAIDDGPTIITFNSGVQSVNVDQRAEDIIAAVGGWADLTT